MGMVDRARLELQLIGEEPETIEGYLKVIQAFVDMGHSGGSASVAIPVINKLLHQKPLSPLTDWSHDWQYHDKEFWDGITGIWQSQRDSTAFSKDGGKTYFLLANKNLTFTSQRDKRWKDHA